jgi:hypothetical protein
VHERRGYNDMTANNIPRKLKKKKTYNRRKKNKGI